MANTDLESETQQQHVSGRGLGTAAHPSSRLASVVDALCSRCSEQDSVLRGPGLTMTEERETRAAVGSRGARAT